MAVTPERKFGWFLSRYWYTSPPARKQLYQFPCQEWHLFLVVCLVCFQEKKNYKRYILSNVDIFDCFVQRYVVPKVQLWHSSKPFVGALRSSEKAFLLAQTEAKEAVVVSLPGVFLSTFKESWLFCHLGKCVSKGWQKPINGKCGIAEVKQQNLRVV